MERATLRFYGDLTDLARGVDRDGTVEVPIGSPRSVKDVVESVGVPHTDVGLLVIDGAAVGFDRLVAGGERIAVYPPFAALEAPQLLRPPAPHRFVVDVHLGTLARNLRLLGFDVWYRSDADDPELAEVAELEHRVLLTRDRGLLMRGSVVHGHCVRSQEPFTQTLEVCRRFELVPAFRPFTRCLSCNAALVDVAEAEVAGEVPPLARGHDRYARCTGCGQVYWPGTHHTRLRGLVASLRASLAAGPRPAGGGA